MAIPINIEDLLSKQKVESNRIEFKAGWNPSSIYHSICAFANDIDNLGGGYILVGVEEENGVAVRPVKGLEDNQLDKIQREMLQFNTMMDPIYYPRISVEEIDERKILVIWVTSGHNLHILCLLMLQQNLRSLYSISVMEHHQLKLKEKILIGFVIWPIECLTMIVVMRI